MYSIRLRQKLGFFEDFNDLIEPSYYDTYKGIFLPLTMNLNFTKVSSNLCHEHYLRMIRLPVFMCKRK
jgi:hypothetical protein